MKTFLLKIMALDKWMHHGVGAAIVLASYAGLLLTGLAGALQHVLAIAAGYLLARGAAWTKECFDEAHPDKHTKDSFDAEATIAGASYATAMLFIALLVSHA
jgi:hypothetical protein